LSGKEIKGSYDHGIVESSVMEDVLRVSERPDGILLDGPPFVSGIPHPGTAWNKVIKDAYSRYKVAVGVKQKVRPGYDCHGLPIELAVQKELGISAKEDINKYGLENFVGRCNDLAKKNKDSMTRVFKRLGVAMDWEHPYCTSTSDYVEAEWREFKLLYEKGLVEREKRVFYWCPKDETVLSDYEVNNYKEMLDKSIYMKFMREGNPNHYFLVWTTTPWTVPANVALMVNPNEYYVEAELNHEVYVLAEARLQVLGGKAVVLRKFKGAELSGASYVHPLSFLSCQKIAHRVVLSEDFVNVQEGTGIVHVAPAHGQEDFQVGLKNNLPMLDLIDEKGRYRQSVERYAGEYVRDANQDIISDLASAGALFKEELVNHRYPICWRCGTPLIMRPTEQWLIKVTKGKDDLIKAASSVRVVPPWLKEARFMPWIRGLGDWVISRQRYWGTPIPIWVCDKCGEIQVVGSIAELEALSGRKIKDSLGVHRPKVDEVVFRHSCGGTMRRVEDVFDVWFDSGSAPYASSGLWPPIKYDLVLEGQDQFSGWFSSLAKISSLLWSDVPYSTVLAHGMALDENGREMHKSLGNYVDVEAIVNEYGADAFRLFFMQHTPWEDVRFGKKGLEDAIKKINILWNLFYFTTTYMNLDDYHPVQRGTFAPEDRWLLSRLTELNKSVTELMDGLQFDAALKLLLDFTTEDLSRWYVKLVRKRTWVEEKDDPSKQGAYYALYWALDGLTRMLHPFIPFVTTYLLSSLPDEAGDFDWPRIDFPIDKGLETKMNSAKAVVAAGLAARNKSGIKVRHPLRKLLVSGVDLGELADLVAEQVNVKEIKQVAEEEFLQKKINVRYDVLGSKFREKTNFVAEKAKLGAKEVEIDGKTYSIPKEAVEVVYEPKAGYQLVQVNDYKVFLDTTVDPELEKEALAREILRRVQETRKRAKLSVEDRIDLVLVGSDEIYAKVQDVVRAIAEDARAVSVAVDRVPPEGDWFSQEWDLDGDRLSVFLRKRTRAVYELISLPP